jgi:hypothetical protein
MSESEIEKLKEKGLPFEKNGISYCFSTYKNEWVSAKIKELPVLSCDTVLGYSSYSRPSEVMITIKLNKPKRR